MTDHLGDWSPAELETNGRMLLAQLREHFRTLRDQPVGTSRPAFEIRSALDEHLPTDPQPFDAILAQTWDQVRPDLTLWNHPRFHAYFSNSSSGPAMLAEMLTAAFNVNAMLWHSAPAASAVEVTVLRWLAEMLGYPAGGDAVLVDGASLATLYALAAAREKLDDVGVREHGLAGRDLPPLRVYASDQTHSSVDKAAITLGIGLDNVVRIPTDHTGRLNPQVLDTRLTDDRRAGCRPVAVVANVGTTAIGAIDSVDEIADVCTHHRVWLHVDAAYGGFWRLADQVRIHLPDLSRADSVVASPHKVLLCPMEVSALFCRQPATLTAAFSLVPEYLRTRHDDSSVDFMNYSLQLGRQFRALKLWWVIKSFGATGLAKRLDEAARLADLLRQKVRADRYWSLENQSPFPLVCLRYLSVDPTVDPGRIDALNEQIHHTVNARGRSYVSHTILDTGYVIRISIGNIHTTETDIDSLWHELIAAAHDCDRHSALERSVS